MRTFLGLSLIYRHIYRHTARLAYIQTTSALKTQKIRTEKFDSLAGEDCVL